MGKRKSKRKVVKKAGPPPLDTQFTCPFCNHEKAVTCDMYAIIWFIFNELMFYCFKIIWMSLLLFFF